MNNIRVLKLLRMTYARLKGVLYDVKSAYANDENSYELKKARLVNAYNESTDNPGVYSQLGQLYFDHLEINKAEEVLQRGVKLYPDSAEITELLGWIYHTKEQYQEAIDLLTEFCRRDPNKWQIYFVLGRCYVSKLWNEKKDDAKSTDDLTYLNQKAEEAFIRSFTLNPTELRHLQGIVNYYYDNHQISKAKEYVEKLRNTLAPDDSIYNNALSFRLAECYMREGAFDRAREIYAGGILAEPINHKYYRGYAICSLALKERQHAEEYFRKAEELYHISDVTRHNVMTIREITEKNNSLFIAMQYPVRSLASLKKLYGNDPDLLVIDNEESFKEAIMRESWDTYFLDNMRYDFGHCTEKGDRMIAQNVAGVLMKYFKQGNI
jgi:tetratricopeptide (TPR) repeat protein